MIWSWMLLDRTESVVLVATFKTDKFICFMYEFIMVIKAEIFCTSVSTMKTGTQTFLMNHFHTLCHYMLLGIRHIYIFIFTFGKGKLPWLNWLMHSARHRVRPKEKLNEVGTTTNFSFKVFPSHFFAAKKYIYSKGFLPDIGKEYWDSTKRYNFSISILTPLIFSPDEILSSQDEDSCWEVWRFFRFKIQAIGSSRGRNDVETRHRRDVHFECRQIQEKGKIDFTLQWDHR